MESKEEFFKCITGYGIDEYLSQYFTENLTGYEKGTLADFEISKDDYFKCITGYEIDEYIKKKFTKELIAYMKNKKAGEEEIKRAEAEIEEIKRVEAEKDKKIDDFFKILTYENFDKIYYRYKYLKKEYKYNLEYNLLNRLIYHDKRYSILYEFEKLKLVECGKCIRFNYIKYRYYTEKIYIRGYYHDVYKYDNKVMDDALHQYFEF